jgi:hypothetical protein
MGVEREHSLLIRVLEVEAAIMNSAFCDVNYPYMRERMPKNASAAPSNNRSSGPAALSYADNRQHRRSDGFGDRGLPVWRGGPGIADLGEFPLDCHRNH